MFNIKIYNFEKKYLLEELIKIFLRPSEYRILGEEESDDNLLEFNKENLSDRNAIKREIYDKLSCITGKKPEWGILTGIRPVKLIGERFENTKSREDTIKYMMDYFYLSEEKAHLIMDMYDYQIKTCGKAQDNSAGIYIGIPFCPTRCVYCSFASNQVEYEEIEKYLKALHKEIEYVGHRIKECGIIPETIYIGGGTPTTLNENDLEELLAHIREAFDFSTIREFSVEAGRPDTITEEKLDIMKKYKVDRISINPQSMKAETLDLIGRKHSPKDVIEVFSLAVSKGFKSINADIIAGLPRESTEDFMSTLKKVISMGADNITVHSLAVKRASKLVDIDKDYHYKIEDIVSQDLKESQRVLIEDGFKAYYLYRQKHMAGAYENTGYCLDGKECIYNIRIMDEHQMIIALGAGGISKSYYPTENRLERVPNVTNYEEYINRIDEMLDRKEKELFRRKK